MRLACDRCDHEGQHRKDKLIAQFGADAMLPYLRYEIAKCERHQAGRWHDRGYAATPKEAMAAFKARWVREDHTAKN